MGNIEKFCQSCGMPMEKDPQTGGTNADGSKNLMYCSYCYQSGNFVGDFKNSGEMITLVKGKLKEMGYGPVRQWLFTMNIPRLKRWQS
jgi:hypothetical protein